MASGKSMNEPAQLQVSPLASVGRARPILSTVAPVPAVKPPVDRCAVASAICGLTAFIPVVSQIAGVVLGVLALRRLGRARRAGQPLAGWAWAVTGIVSSVCVLLCWILVVAVLGGVLWMFVKTSAALDHLPVTPPR
jgi:hypothetical protein